MGPAARGELFAPALRLLKLKKLGAEAVAASRASRALKFDPETYISRLSLARPTPPVVKFVAHTHRPRTASPASLGRR